MGKPKARPVSKEAGKGRGPATRPESKKAARPSSVAQTRQPAQCRVVPAGRQGQAASEKQDQAPKRSQGNPAPARSRAACAASVSPPRRPPLAPVAPLGGGAHLQDVIDALDTRAAGPEPSPAGIGKSPRAQRAPQRGNAEGRSAELTLPETTVQGDRERHPEKPAAESTAAEEAEEGAGAEAHEPAARVDAATATETATTGNGATGGTPVGAAALGAMEMVPAATEIAETVGEAWEAAEAIAATGGGSTSPFAMAAFAPPPAEGFGSGSGSGAVLSQAEEPAPPRMGGGGIVGGSGYRRPEEARRLTGPKAEVVGEEAEDGAEAQSSGEERRL
ncbi:unnamed protein product [Closterium sp. NIES-65]|nr:unnamed protein product [Closterium sp. NIES-65]